MRPPARPFTIASVNTPNTTTEAHANTRPSIAEDASDHSPIRLPALGPALNEPGYYVGRVERNLYWVADSTNQSAFLMIPRRTSPSTASSRER